ncbi:MAG: hypothetical protein FWE48_04070 [Coriobacteriia bacterium]|nr:hypothetical protein [Coriobacteriia bacterium]MCL2746253.1 hypothetical protein [Coriobacteriia bacterium]MCL2871126.1 hypothetical protein [Coriobacteriia bacterium]
MQRTDFDGILSIAGGTYEHLSISGVCNCSGNLAAQIVDIDGILNCDKNLETGKFDCDGIANIKGNVRADLIDVDGYMNIGRKSRSAKLEASEIRCRGIITCLGTGEINADLIDAEGYINATEIVGEKVIIKSQTSILMKWLANKWSKVDTIEATTIELSEVTAKVVNGHDITVGENCVIDKLDCSGRLIIHPTATIKEITGDHIRITT